jgi:putative flippase GtrA
MNSVARRLAVPARYLAFSGLSFAVNLGITAGLHEGFDVDPEVSFAVALVVVFLMNFAGLRWWIFSGTDRPVASQFLGFGLSSLGFRGLEYCGYLLLYRLAGLDYLLAAVAVIGAAFVAKYAVYNSWLFSRSGA